MKVIQVSDRPASQAFYSVAGRLLFIATNDVELRNLIVELFSGWQLTSISKPDRVSDVQINFNCGEPPQTIPGSLNHFEIAEGGKCYTVGADFYLTFSN